MVLTDRERYRVGCGGLVGATFACKMLGKGQSGVSIGSDVVGASMVALVGSSASGGGCCNALVVGHFFSCVYYSSEGWCG